MEGVLNQLLEKLTKALGDRLVSVVLYGSAVTGDHHENFSDLNVLCVLQQVTARELADAEPVFRWWREKKNPAPLLLSEHEVQTSTDCFAIEFHDIKNQHRILQGKDVISNLVVDGAFYGGCWRIRFPLSACCSATRCFCTGWRRTARSGRSFSRPTKILASIRSHSISCWICAKSGLSRARWNLLA